MALKRDQAEGRQPLPPIEAGTHVVRLCRVFDLGVQMGEWKGEKKRGNQIYVVFEFVNEFMPNEDGTPNKELPRVSGKFIKLYKNAEKGVEFDFCRALDPAGTHAGDWASMVRARLPAFATVTINDRGRDQIDALSPVLKGFDVPAGKVDIQVFDLDTPDKEVWDKMPTFLKEKLAARIRNEDLPPVKYGKTEAEAKASSPVASVTQGIAMEQGEDTVTAEVGEDDVPW